MSTQQFRLQGLRKQSGGFLACVSRAEAWQLGPVWICPHPWVPEVGVRELRAAIRAKHLLGLQSQTFQIVLSMNTAFCQQLLPAKKAFAIQWSDRWCCC